MDSIRILDGVSPTAKLNNGGERATIWVDAALDAWYNPDGTPRKFATSFPNTLVDDGNSGSSFTVDFSLGTKHILTLTANCTLSFSNTTDGGQYVLLLKQDGTGSRTVTWPATTRWPSSTAPTLTTTAGAIDLTTFMHIDSANIEIAAFNTNYTP